MDTNLATALVSTSGAAVVALAGLWFNSFHIGRRIDDLRADYSAFRSEARQDIRELRQEFQGFKEMVNSKFAALDLEIAKLMDKR